MIDVGIIEFWLHGIQGTVWMFMSSKEVPPNQPEVASPTADTIPGASWLYIKHVYSYRLFGRSVIMQIVI